MSSILSRYPALRRAALILNGPPPSASKPYDLFDLGCEITRMHARALARQGQTHTPMGAPTSSDLASYDEMDRRGVAGD